MKLMGLLQWIVLTALLKKCHQPLDKTGLNMNRKTILAISGLLLFIGMDASSMASEALAYYRPVLDSTGKLSGPIFTMAAISPDGDLKKSFLIDSAGDISKFIRPGWEDYYLKFNVNSQSYNLIDAKNNQKVIVPEEVMPIFANSGDPLTFKSDGSIVGDATTIATLPLSQSEPSYNNYKVIEPDDKVVYRYYVERRDSNGTILRFDSYGKVIGVQSGNLTDLYITPTDLDSQHYALMYENGIIINDIGDETYKNDDGLSIVVHGSTITVTQPDNYFFKTIAINPSNQTTEKFYSMEHGMPIPAITQTSTPGVTQPLPTSTVGNVESKVLYFTKSANNPEVRFFIDPASTTKLDTELCKTNGFSVFDENVFLVLSDSFYSGRGFSATYSIPSSDSFLPCVLQRVTINKATK